MLKRIGVLEEKLDKLTEIAEKKQDTHNDNNQTACQQHHNNLTISTKNETKDA